ncbi:NAD(P)-binding protein [Coprinellus micaceus]|uniref:NAD(P)-binding protein n=1 Tax=Coprinellus micaceus TaxID=71717 RepID=A0A4Y7THZ6_COPMI|nr:NAD(P)-binding protein [Coprinellus micaceus]
MPNLSAVRASLAEVYPPKSTFSVDDIPDLTGKVTIVTGANAGVGKETAKALLNHNAKVYFAARSQEKAEQAIQELKTETGKEGIFLKLDLGDLRSVKASAEEFLRKEDALHILFNNAGVMAPPVENVTAQGYDLQFGTNVLGHFYFTRLLIPALLNATKSSRDGKARIVNTSSSGSYIAAINFDTLKDSALRRKKGAQELYSQSKLGNVLVSNELARRYGSQGIVSTSLNPGNLDSELTRHWNKVQTKVVRALILHPVPFGALTQLYAGTTEEGANLNGQWLKPWARVGQHPNPLARDERLAKELWEWCEAQVANI